MLPSVETIIRGWKEEAGLTKNDIILVGANQRKVLTICTSKPGLMIGRGGYLVDKYKAFLKEEIPSLDKIEFVETDRYYIR